MKHFSHTFLHLYLKQLLIVKRKNGDIIQRK